MSRGACGFSHSFLAAAQGCAGAALIQGEIMRFVSALLGILFAAVCLLAAGPMAMAQNAGNSTAVTGTVADPTGAVIPGATVTIHNPVSGLERTAGTDASGNFSIANVPFNPYHLMVTATGFATYAQDID